MIIGRTQTLNMCNKCGQELRGKEIRNMLPHVLLDEGGRKVAIDIDLLYTERRYSLVPITQQNTTLPTTYNMPLLLPPFLKSYHTI